LSSKEESLIRAVILAAGRGERMQPLSEFVPKPLLFCAGMTLIQRLIRSFREGGVRKFTVGVGWKGDLVREHLTALPQGKLIEVVDVPDYRKGPLQTLVSALSTVDDRAFLISPADYVVEPQTVTGLVTEHVRGPGSRVMTVLVDPNKQEGTPVFGSPNGLVAGVGGSAISFDKIGSSAMLLAADRSFKTDCRAALEDGGTQVTSAINRIISDGKPVRYAIVEQPWFDVDDIQALLVANHHLLQHMASRTGETMFVPSGQEVDWHNKLPSSTEIDVGAKATGPVLLCAPCHIEAGATVGPFVTVGRNGSVGAGAVVVESVLFEGAKIPAGAYIADAAVRGQTVYRSEVEHVT
jgi:NDP-sugar pyrophosphorylase family protein